MFAHRMAHGRGTKRPRGRSLEEDNPVRSPARPRVQADSNFSSPGNSRNAPMEETTNSCWVIKGEGNTDLIRRQLDLVDAIAPNATIHWQFSTQPPRSQIPANKYGINRHQERRTSAASLDLPNPLPDIDESPPPEEPKSQPHLPAAQVEKRNPNAPPQKNPLPQKKENPTRTQSTPTPTPAKPIRRPPNYPPTWQCTPDHVPEYQGWDEIELAEEERLEGIREEKVQADRCARAERASGREDRGRRGRFGGVYTL
jgi:hypothetical protein